jgi:hypothetical protein
MIWEFSRGRRKAASHYFGVYLTTVAAFSLVAVGCRRPASSSGDITIKESITPQPVRMGTETISLLLVNAASLPVTGAHVQLEGDMTHPGMAPVFADAIEDSPGRYTAPIDFTMGGDWVVLFHITLSDGRKMERQMDVKGVESN